MNIFFLIAAFICMFGVVAVLMTGLFAMSKGGSFNEKYGNKLMQARVGLQGLAVLFFLLAYFIK